MPALTIANFVVYVLQLAAIVAIGAGLPVIVGLKSPRGRLIYWRTLLLICLVLPLVQPLTPAPLPESVSATTAAVAVPAMGVVPGSGMSASTPAAAVDPPGSRAGWPVGRMLAAVILAGIAARLVWLGAGFVTLGRIRRLSGLLDPRPAGVDRACLLTGADAEFRVTAAIARPVTFGAARPVVVVPEEFGTLDEPQQTAVACHELVHVRQHDWLRTVGDELIRSLVWFHPALWWLLDQIHLTAEQVVDQEVVALTGARQPYLAALLRLAVPSPRMALRPAPLFIRQSHLRERVALLLKEVSMSRPRVAVSFVTMAVALMVGGRLVVSAFPLQGTTPAPATRDYDTLLKNYQSLLVQQEDSKVAADLSAPAAAASRQTQTAKPQGSLRPGEPVPQPAVPPAAGAGLTKINDVPPVYPPEAAAAGISGPVVLTLTIDAGGRVTDAAVVKGDAMLAPAALEAVRQWRYRPIATAPVVATVAVNVVDSQQVAETVAGVRVGGDVKAPTKVKNVLPIYPAAARSERIQGVVITEARIGPSGIVTEARILRSIPLLDAAALDALMRWEFSPTLLNGVPVPVIMTVTTNFVLDSKPKTEAVEGGVAGGARGGVPGGVVGGAGETTPPQGAVRVGGDIAAPRKTVNVLPVYPEEAKAAGVQGVVIVEAVVGKDGKVESAKILRSIPMLDQAALEAVRQWEFTPTLVHGAPVDVIMTMTVNFKLE